MQQPAPPPEEEPQDEPEELVTAEALPLMFWPLWVLPFVGVGLGLLFAFYFPESVNDFYFDTVFPFGITFWLGTFIAYGWEIQKLWIQAIPRKYAPWLVVAAIVAVIWMMGGPAAIVDDPWLAGMIIVPGVRIWMSYQRKHRGPPRHV